jgi:hypothetical protein
MAGMDPDEVTTLVKTLIAVWEHAIGREDTLRLVLDDCCPDWRHHYSKYENDPGTLEHTRIVCEPLRRLSEAILAGTADHLLLEQAVADMLKKPN